MVNHCSQCRKKVLLKKRERVVVDRVNMRIKHHFCNMKCATLFFADEIIRAFLARAEVSK